MNRKVFLSFLGTSDYLPVKYRLGNYTSNLTRFIQEALIDLHCAEWDENDCIYIFYTQLSEQLNWNDLVRDNNPSGSGLKSILDRKEIKATINGIRIDEGKDEHEIWNIFNSVFSILKENDEIYFDITHAFRSIPIFASVLLNYSQCVKKTSLKNIQYGAIETLGGIGHLINTNPEDRIAPIIDLTNIIRLQNLTQSAIGFFNYGTIADIGNELNEGRNKEGIGEILCSLKKATTELDEYIILNRIDKIIEGEFVSKLDEWKQSLIEDDTINFAERDIILKLHDRLSAFKSNSENNILEAVRWAYEFNMIPQLYTIGQEFIITLVCRRVSVYNPYPKDEANSDKKFRVFISAIMGMNNEAVKSGDFKRDLGEYLDATKSILSQRFIQEIRQPYSIIANNRNTLNHGKRTDYSLNTFKQQFETYFPSCIKIAQNDSL